MKALSGYVIGRRMRDLSRDVDGSRIAYKTSADVISKVVTLVVTVAAARALSAPEFGVMALAMTTGWILGVASDAGLPMYLATRIAQTGGRERVLSTVSAVMQWRLLLGGGALGVGVMIGATLVPVAVLAPFTLIVLHQLFGAILDTLAHAYRGLGRTDIESSFSIVHRGAVALGALTVLSIAPSLLWLSIALAVPPLVTLIASHRVLRTTVGPATHVHVADRLTPRQFWSDVAPLGIGVLLSALYFRCDVYFLERLHGVELVGLYNAAFRLVDAIRLFPAAALAVAYPMLCNAANLKPLRKLSSALACASLMVAAAIYFTAHRMLAFVYGEAYAAAGDVLQLLSLCVPFFYVNYALSHQLIAWQGQRAFLGITAAALATNLVSNTALIARWGMNGAALSTLITELVVCTGCALALRRR